MSKKNEKIKYLISHIILNKRLISNSFKNKKHQYYNKIMKPIWLIVLIGCASLFSSGINAEIIDNGNYTTDTLTGLDWLDISETKGLSYYQVLSLIEEGGKLEGWTYATRQQINTFFSNAGLIKSLNSKKNLNSVSRLLDLLGRTNLREKEEWGDECKFLYGSEFTVEFFKKKTHRVYIGSIAKVGVIDNERGVVILNNILVSLGASEINDKVGSALVRKRVFKN